jgi:hypothetical protein
MGRPSAHRQSEQTKPQAEMLNRRQKIDPRMKKKPTEAQNSTLTNGQWWRVKDGYVQIL